MKTGTASVLFGAHCFFIHPLFVAIAWTRLYGFPRDPRLWLAFFVHDLGYWGCEQLDDEKGERHVEFGAAVLHRLCDRMTTREVHTSAGAVALGGKDLIEAMARQGWKLVPYDRNGQYTFGPSDATSRVTFRRPDRDTTWRDFALYHSRFRAKQDGQPFSRLCVADKLALCLEPWWLYLPRVLLSGELDEYLASALDKNKGKYAGEPETGRFRPLAEVASDPDMTLYRLVRYWHARMINYQLAWVERHRDGRADTWTPTRSTRSGAEESVR